MHQTLQLDKFEGVAFKYDYNIFKFQPKNFQIRNFRSQILGFLVLNQTLQLIEFKDSDFKYDNIIFKLQPKNSQIRHF